RREGQKYPVHTFRFTGEPAYFHHIVSAAKGLMEETGLSPKDFKYVVFHQPNVKFPQRVAEMLGFSQEQLKPGLLSGDIGNTYAAASLIGLASTLDVAAPGDRILVVSFGSGAGSDAISLVVGNCIEEVRSRAPTVAKLVARAKIVDYAIYLKYRGMIER
ncbi:MAG: hydroxymethylglutaryl-CoA synthase, partial [Thermofilum sp.]